MTWDDIRIACLQKMFLITGDVLIEDSTTEPYIKSMPYVANEGLKLLSTAGKYIVKSITVTQDGTDDGVNKYDLSELTTDFYSFGGNRVYFTDDENYKPTTYYSTEGKSVFVLFGNLAGSWEVFYNAYPQELTKDTLGTEELVVDPEVIVLLPLYMASQLYKDDDIGLSTQWRNEFEVARELLLPNANIGTIEFGDM